MDKKNRVDTVLSGIIVIASLLRGVFCQGSGDGPMCTTAAIFEFCLEEQGLDMSQSTAVLCSVDQSDLFSCQSDSLFRCHYSSPIYQEDFTKPFTDLLRECSGPQPCISSSCLNGATCTRYGTIQFCMCAQGYYGTDCQSTYSQGSGSTACVSSPCLNGGSCKSYGSTQVCFCSSGFSGERCEFGQGSQQSCISTVCRNGGTCRNIGGMEICQCMVGYYGQTCDKTQSSPGDINRPCIDCEYNYDYEDEEGDHGIGVATIAGIAIGATVCVLLFAIFLAILIKKRRKSTSTTQPSRNNVQLRPLPSLKTPSAPKNSKDVSSAPHPILSKHASPTVKSNEYSPPPEGKETPMRWEEDYIDPMADRNKVQHAIPGETEDGYTLNLPRIGQDGVYEDLEVYTELDENTMERG